MKRLLALPLLSLLFVGNAVAAEEKKEDWNTFVMQFQMYLNDREEHFTRIVEVIKAQPVYQVEMHKNGLVVKWDSESDWSSAPNDMAQRLTPHFRALHLLTIQADTYFTQFMQHAPAHGYKNLEILPIMVHSADTEGVTFCEEDKLIHATEEYGRCWVPLQQENWYVDFVWVKLPT